MEQINNSIIFYAHYIAGKIGKTGLTPTISIWKVTETGVSSKIVTAAAVTEVGGGYYFYKLTNTLVDSIGEYLGLFTTTDLTVNQQDIPTCIPVGRGGVEYLNDVIIRSTIGLAAANLDTQLSGINTKIPANVATTGAAMTLTDNAVSAAAVSAGGARKIADHVWDDLRTDHLIAGSFGEGMNAASMVSGKLNTMLEADGTNSKYTAASLVNAPTGSGGGDTGLTQADIRTAIGMASANLDTQLANQPTNASLVTALAGSDDAVLAAIAALNNLSSAGAQAAAAAALTAYNAAKEVTLTDIKAKTDLLPDVNIASINNVQVIGAGIPDDNAWRPVGT